MASPGRLLVLIRGGGDLASAIAHRLFRDGRAVVIVEEPDPRVVRRKMAFAQAVFDGEATVEGVRAVRTTPGATLERLLEARESIPLLVDPTAKVIRTLRPTVLVDGRMRKRERSDSSVAEASLVIGLGPGFRAGREAHVVIETARGPDLGKVITEGEALPYDGMPVDLGGFTKERYLYAPVAGVFRTPFAIGALVEDGQAVGEVAGVSLMARVGGTIRGILKDGVRVTRGQKVVDIDPREEAVLSGISQKARAIAEGVAAAIVAWEASPEGEE
ncbi:MAG: selenium-dependent molybdenum cofactor biosynthesis protein YqeB [Candidatus Methylomirabilales bacterium]